MDTNKQKQTWTIWYVVAAGLGALILNQYWNVSRQTDAISYSQFEQPVAGKKISAVVIDRDIIEGTIKEPGPDGKTKFVTVRVDPATRVSLPPRASRFPARRPPASSALFWPGPFPP
jgi:cell division protease FtsH